eukprot:3378700-Prymnesium_polylepis.1
MTDPRAVPAPVQCAFAWDPARVVRASGHACHVRVPCPRSPFTHASQWEKHTSSKTGADGPGGRNKPCTSETASGGFLTYGRYEDTREPTEGN